MTFANIVFDFGKCQMVSELTKRNTILDLLIGSTPYFIAATVIFSESFLKAIIAALQFYLVLEPLILHA